MIIAARRTLPAGSRRWCTNRACAASAWPGGSRTRSSSTSTTAKRTATAATGSPFTSSARPEPSRVCCTSPNRTTRPGSVPRPSTPWPATSPPPKAPRAATPTTSCTWPARCANWAKTTRTSSTSKTASATSAADRHAASARVPRQPPFARHSLPPTDLRSGAADGFWLLEGACARTGPATLRLQAASNRPSIRHGRPVRLLEGACSRTGPATLRLQAASNRPSIRRRRRFSTVGGSLHANRPGSSACRESTVGGRIRARTCRAVPVSPTCRADRGSTQWSAESSAGHPMRSPRILIDLLIVAVLTVLAGPTLAADADDWHGWIDAETERLYDDVVEWRRHFHRNPELSNREFETAAYIAEFLRGLGMEVTTGVAHTGVIGVLEGGRPGPVVGLRADMDALPVPSRVGLAFSPEVTSEFLGDEVPVSHACGHDTHMAMLMGVAEMFAERRDELPGTVKFIFQPAEEGAPPGEEGGAELMVEEGVLQNPDVDVIFGQHINSQTEVGTIRYRPEGTMAAADRFVITVKGKQTHGSTPWTGVDPILTSAKIIEGLQTIISRQTELTKAAAVISVGKIESGVRNNIIPEEAEMIGTIRTLDTEMQDIIHKKIRHVATKTAESMGATAEVEIEEGYPVTYNDPDLTADMVPTLEKLAGKENIVLSDAITGAEDFSFFQKKIPGFYFFVGGMPQGMDPADAAPHHTPDFYIEEEGMKLGVKALAALTVDYMMQNAN